MYFRLFTPLYVPPEDKLESFDCIAVPGLGGHAFGPWKDHDSQHMWLRDSLPHDMPQARVLIYGYDSGIVQSQSFQNLDDIASKFCDDLKIVRQAPTARPLLFIAHSLGGLVLKRALKFLASTGSQPQDQLILSSTLAILFFGVPNHGMDIASLLAMVQGQHNLPLISTLDKDAGLLQDLVHDFRKVYPYHDCRVVSFYETRTSPTAVLDSPGKWKMGGKPVVLVDRFSAQSGRSWEDKQHIDMKPINRNHSAMIKFSDWDPEYNTVQSVLSELVSKFPAVISARLQASEPFFTQGGISQLGPYKKLFWQVGLQIDTRDQRGKALLWAVRYNRTDLVQLLLDKDIDIDVTEVSEGEKLSALHLAVNSENKDLVALLISKEAYVNATTHEGRTPLHLAASKRNEYITRCLVKGHAHLEALDSLKQTALHIAASQGHEAVVQVLLEGGALHHVTTQTGNTALHFASSKCHFAVAQILLEHKANANALNREGHTALHLAAIHGNTAMIQLLLRNGADIDIETEEKADSDIQRSQHFEHNVSALYLAAKNDHEEAARILLKNHASSLTSARTDTWLHVAVEGGNTKAAHIFLQLGLNQNAVNHAGNTPLHYAVKHHDKTLVRLPLEHKAETNVQDKEEETPLHHAVRRGDKDSLRLLLEYNAEVDVQDKAGATPLYSACDGLYPVDCAKLLIEHRANVTIPTKNGQTPLHVASKGTSGDELVKRLIQHGAEVDALDSNQKTPLHMATAARTVEFGIIRILIDSKANVNAVNIEGNTPLHNIVVDTGAKNLRAVRYLIEHGADVNARNKNGNSVLLHATSNAWSETYRAYVVALLLHHHADPNAVNNYGNTPLFFAISNSNPELVTLLLDHGAKIDTRDKHKNTLLHLAASSLSFWNKDGNSSIITLLIDRGAEPEAINEEGYTPKELALARNNLKAAALFPSIISDTKLQRSPGASIAAVSSQANWPDS